MKKLALFFSSLLFQSICFATVLSVGPLGPGTGSNNAAVGVEAWSDPENITVEDGSNATSACVGTDSTNYIQGSNFGFNIPVGSTIRGIFVSIKRQSSPSSNNVVDNIVKLVNRSGVVVGDNKSVGATWPIGLAYAFFGGSTDLWNAGLSYADINSTAFGVVASGSCSGSGLIIPQVDYMTITVYYTPPVTQIYNGTIYNGTFH